MALLNAEGVPHGGSEHRQVGVDVVVAALVAHGTNGCVQGGAGRQEGDAGHRPGGALGEVFGAVEECVAQHPNGGQHL